MVGSTVFVGIMLVVATLQLTSTREDSQLVFRMQRLEMQAALRARWIEWHDRTRHLDLDHYPKNGRRYSEPDRELIREYWSIVVMNEFSIIHDFQDGLLRDHWPHYEAYIIDALNNEAQAEEWFYYASSEARDYELAYRAAVQEIIDREFPNLDAGDALYRREERMGQ